MKTKIFGFLQNLLLVLSVGLCVFILAQKFVFKESGIFGYRTFVIVTRSMSPILEIGDVIVIKKVEPSTIKEGDVVTYLGEESDFKGKIVTHLVKDIDKDEQGNYLFYTKGNVTNMMDPVVREDQLYGKLVYRLYIISLVSKLIRSKYGFIALIFVPLVIILIKQLWNIKHEMNKDPEKLKEENEINEYKKKHKHDKKIKKEKKSHKKLFHSKKKDEIIVIKDASEKLEETMYDPHFREKIEEELQKTLVNTDLRKELEREKNKTNIPSRGLENTLINSHLDKEIKKEKVPDIIIIKD